MSGRGEGDEEEEEEREEDGRNAELNRKQMSLNTKCHLIH
jgi:hypothetical protein